MTPAEVGKKSPGIVAVASRISARRLPRHCEIETRNWLDRDLSIVAMTVGLDGADPERQSADRRFSLPSM